MKSAFQQVDTDRSGTLDANEVYKAISVAGFQVQSNAFGPIFQKFDRKKKNALDFDGYIELCIFLGTIRNIFQFYDTNRQGVVQFNFDSFISMATFIYP